MHARLAIVVSVLGVALHAGGCGEVRAGDGQGAARAEAPYATGQGPLEGSATIVWLPDGVGPDVPARSPHPVAVEPSRAGSGDGSFAATLPPQDDPAPDFVVRVLEDALPGAPVSERPTRDGIGYPASTALLDLDGDHDLDLFIGRLRATDAPACVLRNVSTPGRVRFERDDAWCLPFAGDEVGGLPIDLDEDGVHELLLTSMGEAWVVRGQGAALDVEPIDLALRSDACALIPATTYDWDLDGDLDVYLPCQVRTDVARFRREYAPRFLENAGGVLQEVPPSALGPLGVELNTLAVTVTDLDDDGLPDVLTAVDTFSSPSSRNLLSNPGGVFYRCAPDDTCVFEEQPWLADRDAWGSWMGIGLLRWRDERAVYLTDWGPNRLLPVRGRAPFDDAAELAGGELGSIDGVYLFSWSALVEDFDSNGLDDVLVTQGCVGGGQLRRCATHFDAVLTQQAGGELFTFSDAVGLPINTSEAWRSSRGLIRADLDGDGALELVTSAWGGAPQVLALDDPGPPRCTIEAVPRVVPSLGWGVQWAATRDGVWNDRDAGGMTRTASPPWIAVPLEAGLVRFASGWVEPFVCGPGRRARVEEPAWVTVTTDGGEVRARVVEERALTALVVVAPDGTATYRGDRVGDAAPLPDDAVGVYLEVDGRWVARNFLLP